MPSNSFSLNDAEIFGQFYNNTHLIVFRFLYGMAGGSFQEIEDLTAETFFRAWKSRHRFHGSAQAALGWVLQIGRNQLIDTYRRKKVRGEDLILNETLLVHPQSSPEEQVALHQQIQLIWNQLQTLSPNQREMIVLRYILDWPIKQIAEHLNMTDNTVSVTIQRILIRLRDHLPE